MAVKGSTTATRPIKTPDVIAKLIAREDWIGVAASIQVFTMLRGGSVFRSYKKRKGEAVISPGMTWDVFVEAGRVRQGIEVYVSKQDKRFKIPLHPALRDKIRWWYEESGRPEPAAPMFPSRRGERTIQDWNRNLKKVLSAYGIDRTSSHALRKTGARKYFEAGGLAATQKFLGHSNSSTTIVYLGIDYEEAKANIEKITF